ncbi:MAG: glycosyltransferase family 4 protein [Flavobacteriales bacterium]|nr:glycosyltransferase family 4 protein [Flavobacteriales bacterium]
MNQAAKRILFVVPYPLGIAPSQRFRFEQYFEVLVSNGFQYEVQPFLDESAMHFLYDEGNFFQKVWRVKLGLLKRMFLMTRLGQFDFVFIHREAAAIGPPIFEWFIAKVFRKKIIFDFDDAIWLKNTSSTNSIITLFKRYRNANNTCKWAHKVSCGNDYLADHARQFNKNVVVNPTTIDTEHLHNRVKQYRSEKITIGWTGTHSTIKYLDALVPILKKLEQEFDFNFLVIADRRPDFDLKSLQFVAWNKQSEIDDLLKMDVGVMPLENDKWASGKCGFKALQYMALGIPAIVSPVGVNTKIVDHGTNGWICQSPEEWEQALRLILEKQLELKDFSVAARTKIEAHYSVKSNTPNFLHLFANPEQEKV